VKEENASTRDLRRATSLKVLGFFIESWEKRNNFYFRVLNRKIFQKAIAYISVSKQTNNASSSLMIHERIET